MAYIGQPPFQEFTSIPTKDNFTGDGSTTTFDLAGEVPLGAENALEVFVANVRQEPGTGKAFTLGQDGNGDFKHFKGVFDHILSDNPDLSGIFVTNVSTHKMAEQIDAAGLAGQIHLVGYDMIQKNVDYLKSGVIDFLISQRPEIQGYQGLYSLYRHVVLKEPVQAKILMQLEIVTLENVDYYHLYGE